MAINPNSKKELIVSHTLIYTIQPNLANQLIHFTPNRPLSNSSIAIFLSTYTTLHFPFHTGLLPV